MKNHNQLPGRSTQNQEVPQGVLAAKLAILGASISTIGDVIATLGAVVALEDLQNSAANGDSNNQNQKDFQSMQKQIDDLTRAVKELQRDNR